MSVLQLNSHSFDHFITQQPISVLYFGAHWCGPCRRFSEDYANISDAYACVQDIAFAYVDVDDEPEWIKKFSIRMVPAVVIIKDNVIIYADTGVLPHAVFLDLIRQAQDCDVKPVLEHEPIIPTRSLPLLEAGIM